MFDDDLVEGVADVGCADDTFDATELPVAECAAEPTADDWAPDLADDMFEAFETGLLPLIAIDEIACRDMFDACEPPAEPTFDGAALERLPLLAILDRLLLILLPAWLPTWLLAARLLPWATRWLELKTLALLRCDTLDTPGRLEPSRVEPMPEARLLPAAFDDRVECMLLEPPPRLSIDRTLLAARLWALWPLWPLGPESRVEPNVEPTLLALLWALDRTLPILLAPTWLPPAWLLPFNVLAMLRMGSSPGPAKISDVCDW